MKDILRVKNLNKSYKNFSLTDVSFSLSEGCITGFIGINGAGKTTTLRTILDLAKKDSGNIQFFGLDMDKNEQQIKNRIGVVLDDGCFYEELSMAEMKSILASAYTDCLNRILNTIWICFPLTLKGKSIPFPKE